MNCSICNKPAILFCACGKHRLCKQHAHEEIMRSKNDNCSNIN